MFNKNLRSWNFIQFKAYSFVNTAKEHRIDGCYQDLWNYIVLKAVSDYVQTIPGSHPWNTAVSFLKRQDNLDMANLGMTPEELFAALDKITDDEMKERLAEARYVKKSLRRLDT